jgi:outer membrane receptor protein involved in Fe transport
MAMGGVLAGVCLAASPSPAQLAAAPSTAAAATPTDQAQGGGVRIEEMVVTARKREERLLDVPVAATALGPQQLQRYTISDLQTIGDQVPNVNIQQSGQGAGAFLAIRGIGSSNQDTSTDSAVTIDIDGVSTDRGRGVPEAIFDLAGVDVLKGPQSLYFGKNSPAGVIALASKDPSDRWEGYLKTGYEFNAEQIYAEGAVGGPINDQLRFRLAFRVSDMFGGWVHNVAQAIADPFHPGYVLPGAVNSEAPEDKNEAGRLTVVWRPNDRFDANFKFLAMRDQTDGSAALLEVGKCAPGQVKPSVFGVIDPYGDCAVNGVTSISGDPAPQVAGYPGHEDIPYSLTNAVVSGLTLNWRLPNLTITSVSGFYWYQESNFSESDATAYAQLGGYDEEVYHSLSQELRIESSFSGPLNFTVGGFLQTEHMTLTTTGKIFDQVPFGVTPDPVTGQTNNWSDFDIDHGDTESAFGELTYKLLHNLELDGGVRYTSENKYGNDGTTYVNASFAKVFSMLTPGDRIIGQVKANNWSPQVTLSWHPASDIMLYAAYKTGFKSGGFANPTVLPGTTTAQEFEYKPESAAGEEVGAKGSFLNGRLSGDITLYRYEYDQLQVTAFDPTTISFLIENAAKARAQGVELQGNWQATGDLSLRVDWAYTDTRYLSFPGAPCWALQAAPACDAATGTQDLAGQPFQLSPLWSGSAGFTYERLVGGRWRVTLSSDLRYNSGYQLGEGPQYVQSPFVLVDASLHVSTPDRLWDLALVGRDLANTFYNLGGGATPGGPSGQFSGQLARPRQVYLEITRRF